MFRFTNHWVSLPDKALHCKKISNAFFNNEKNPRFMEFEKNLIAYDPAGHFERCFKYLGHTVPNYHYVLNLRGFLSFPDQKPPCDVDSGNQWLGLLETYNDAINIYIQTYLYAGTYTFTDSHLHAERACVGATPNETRCVFQASEHDPVYTQHRVTSSGNRLPSSALFFNLYFVLYIHTFVWLAQAQVNTKCEIHSTPRFCLRLECSIFQSVFE